MRDGKTDDLGADIDTTTGNFTKQRETASSSDGPAQISQKLPGGPVPDHMLWETRVTKDPSSSATKEVGVKTSEGDYYSFDHGESFIQIMGADGKREPYVRLQSGQEVSFNAWKSSKKSEMSAVLGKADRDYSSAYLCAVDDFPHLDQMQVESSTAEDYPVLEYTGGFYVRPKDSAEPPKIIVNMEKGQHYQKLLVERETSARKSAEKIGIDFETMKQNPDILKLFIFLHEIGHAEDYIVNYLKSGRNEDPVEANLAQRKKEIGTLPIPGINPVQAKQMYDRQELQQYFLKYQQYYSGLGISSPEELLKAHEVAYHELPSESYADDFAANVLRKHWQTLIKKVES